jgi:hypothetical protein
MTKKGHNSGAFFDLTRLGQFEQSTYSCPIGCLQQSGPESTPQKKFDLPPDRFPVLYFCHEKRLYTTPRPAMPCYCACVGGNLH